MPRSFLIANKRYGKRLDKRSEPALKICTVDTDDDSLSVAVTDDSLQDAPSPDVEISPREDRTQEDDCAKSSEQVVEPFTTLSPGIPYPPQRELLLYHHQASLLACRHDPFLHPLHRNPFAPHTPRYHHYIPAPTSPALIHHSLAQNQQNTDINFNRLNDFVDKIFDGMSVCDIFSCNTCGKQYSTHSNLARHKQIHRDVTDKKARKCPHCDKVYVSMPAFSMHVRTHNEGCACPYCGKRFSRPWLLQGHIRTHTGEKPFRCSMCPKAFADKSNLRAHIQTHSTEKPYSCGRCGKGFALKSYLSKHEESSCMKGLKYHRISCGFTQRTN